MAVRCRWEHREVLAGQAWQASLGCISRAYSPWSHLTVASPIGGSVASRAINSLPEQIGVAVVPGVLLDHVDKDPAHRNRPSGAVLPD
jgi:hypothetical protein